MYLTEALDAMGDILDDEGLNNWPLDQRVRMLHRHEKGMIRKIAEVNSQFSNFKFSIASGTQIGNSLYRYDLPVSLDIIQAVRKQSSSTATRERVIPKRELEDSTIGWYLSGPRHLINAKNENIAIEVDAVKLPAPPYRGTIINPFADGTGVYLETSVGALTSEFPIDKSANAYAGQYFIVTGADAADGSRLVEGQAFSASSSSTVAVGGAAVIELGLELELSTKLENQDTIDSILNVQDKHARLLVLRAARNCFQKKANVAGLSSIREELNFEEQEFTYSIKSRQKQEPDVVRRFTTSIRTSPDLDSDQSFTYY